MLHLNTAGVSGPGLITLANAFNVATRMPEAPVMSINGPRDSYHHKGMVSRMFSALHRLVTYRATDRDNAIGLFDSVIRTATYGHTGR